MLYFKVEEDTSLERAGFLIDKIPMNISDISPKVILLILKIKLIHGVSG